MPSSKSVCPCTKNFHPPSYSSSCMHCWLPLCIALMKRTHQADRDRYVHVMNYVIGVTSISESCAENGVPVLSTAHLCLAIFDIQQASSARLVSELTISLFSFFFLSFLFLFSFSLSLFISVASLTKCYLYLLVAPQLVKLPTDMLSNGIGKSWKGRPSKGGKTDL